MTGWLIQARDLRTGLKAAIVLSRIQAPARDAVECIAKPGAFAATRYTTEPRND